MAFSSMSKGSGSGGFDFNVSTPDEIIQETLTQSSSLTEKTYQLQKRPRLIVAERLLVRSSGSCNSFIEVVDGNGNRLTLYSNKTDASSASTFGYSSGTIPASVVKSIGNNSITITVTSPTRDYTLAIWY